MKEVEPRELMLRIVVLGKTPPHPRNLFFSFLLWRRLLRVPWTARRSNQSVLKEINPEYSLLGLMTEVPILCPPDGKSRVI